MPPRIAPGPVVRRSGGGRRRPDGLPADHAAGRPHGRSAGVGRLPASDGRRVARTARFGRGLRAFGPSRRRLGRFARRSGSFLRHTDSLAVAGAVRRSDSRAADHRLPALLLPWHAPGRGAPLLRQGVCEKTAADDGLAQTQPLPLASDGRCGVAHRDRPLSRADRARGLASDRGMAAVARRWAALLPA